MGLLSAAIDLVLPQRCAGCGEASGTLCSRCQAPLSAQPRLWRPTPAPEALPQVWTITRYDGPARSAIIAHKERARLPLTPYLAAPLARAILTATLETRDPISSRSPGGLGIVAIPAARAARRRRGYDPMGLIAGHAATLLRRRGIDARTMPLLRHARRVTDQAELRAADRIANLRGALVAESGTRVPPRLIVVDDVITTGATLAEAARALSAAGIQVMAAAVIAATARRNAGTGRPA